MYIISIFPHTGHFPCFSELMRLKRRQFYEISKLLYQLRRCRFPFTINKFIDSRTFQLTIMRQRAYLDILFVDVILKHIRKYRHK